MSFNCSNFLKFQNTINLELFKNSTNVDNVKIDQSF